MDTIIKTIKYENFGGNKNISCNVFHYVDDIGDHYTNVELTERYPLSTVEKVVVYSHKDEMLIEGIAVGRGQWLDLDDEDLQEIQKFIESVDKTIFN